MHTSAELFYWEGVHNEQGITGEDALKILAFIDMCAANKTPLSLSRGGGLDKNEWFCHIAYESPTPNHIVGRGYSGAAAYLDAMGKYDGWLEKRLFLKEFTSRPEIQEKMRQAHNAPSQFRRPTPEETGRLVQIMRNGDDYGRKQWEIDMRADTADSLRSHLSLFRLELVDKQFLEGLSNSETNLLEQIGALLDALDAPYYQDARARLEKLVESFRAPKANELDDVQQWAKLYGLEAKAAAWLANQRATAV